MKILQNSLTTYYIPQNLQPFGESFSNVLCLVLRRVKSLTFCPV